MSKWRVEKMGNRCHGHGEYWPEATVSCDGAAMFITVSSYQASEEHVKGAAEELVALLNKAMNVND